MKSLVGRHRAAAAPLASVIIPVFNGEATLAHAIESALAQDFDDFEVIVVDDGSTDSTPKILGAYSSPIRVIKQKRQGVAAARITGSAVAKGQYLAFLDADDLWLKTKLRKTLAAVETDSDCVLAYSNLIPVDDCGCPVGGLYVTDDVARPPTMADLLRQFWPILPSAAVIRHQTFEMCARSYRQFTKPGYEDCYLWLLAREHGPFRYVPEPLVIYRQPPLIDRLYKYREGFRLFARLVTERYGHAGRPLVEEANRAYASALGHQGLLAMAKGEPRVARAYFACALGFHAMRVQNALRLLRSFLPRPIAMRLTGRTRAGY